MAICRDGKRRGIYLALFIDPERHSCFSIYQISWIKMKKRTFCKLKRSLSRNLVYNLQTFRGLCQVHFCDFVANSAGKSFSTYQSTLTSQSSSLSWYLFVRLLHLSLKFRLPKMSSNEMPFFRSPILGDPGAVSRVGSKGGTKVFKYGRKSPWVPTLTKLFPKLQANACS